MAEARDDSTSLSSSVAAAGDSAPGHYQLSLLLVSDSDNSFADCERLYNGHFSSFSLIISHCILLVNCQKVACICVK